MSRAGEVQGTEGPREIYCWKLSYEFDRNITYEISFFSCFVFNHLTWKTPSQLPGCMKTGRWPDLSLGPRLADKKSYEGHFPGPLHPLSGLFFHKHGLATSPRHWGTQLLPATPAPGPGAGSWAGTVLISCQILQPASILCISAHSMRRGC